MKLDKESIIKNIRNKLQELKLPNKQQFENYSNIEQIKVCRMYYVVPVYK